MSGKAPSANKEGLNEKGITLEAVIITAIAALMAAAAGVVVYNIIASESGDINDRAETAQSVPPVFEQTATGELIPINPASAPNPPDNNPPPNNGPPDDTGNGDPGNGNVAPPTTEDCEDGTVADLTQNPPQECRICPGATQTTSSAQECANKHCHRAIIPVADTCPDTLFKEISGSSTHACVISDHAINPQTGAYDPAGTKGEVYCWGDNTNKQIGSATADFSSDLITIGGRIDAVRFILEVSAGNGYTCVTGRRVECWGSNDRFQLGPIFTPLDPPRSSTPDSQIFFSNNVRMISAASNFTCSLSNVALQGDGRPDADGTDVAGAVYCWGAGGSNGDSGQNGRDPDLTRRSLTIGDSRARELNPIRIGTLPDVLPTRRFFYPFATNRPVLGGVTDIATGHDHTCAVTTSNTLYCWGSNGGEVLGRPQVVFNPARPFDPPTTILPHSFLAIQVKPLADLGLSVRKVAAGDSFTCVIADDTTNGVTGGVWCWGSNSHGQTGVTPTPAEVRFGSGITKIPTRVSIGITALENVIAIKAELERVCAILSDKTITCWGSNGNSDTNRFWQNADAANVVRASRGARQALKPTIIPGVSDVEEMIVLKQQVCVLDGSHDFKCFGQDEKGKLGPFGDSAIQTALGHS